MKKRVIVFLFFLLFFSSCISAYSETDYEVDTKEIVSLVPDGVKEYFPDGFMTGEDTVTVAETITFSGFSKFIVKLIGGAFKPFLKTFGKMLAVIVIASVLNAAKNSFVDKNVSKIIGFVTLLSVSIASYDVLKNVWISIENFMKGMEVIIGTMLPVMTLLYSLGGNVSTAVVNSSGTAIILTVINVIYQNGLFPILKILFGLSLAISVGGFKGIESISKTIRTLYTTALSGIMTLLSIFLLFKTNLAVATDGVAARTVKFAGSFIPVVGSALGDSVRSIISGLNLIKSSSGLVGIMIIIFLTLPVLINIIAHKISFGLAGGIAELLGCECEGKLLKNFSDLLNLALAITVAVSILFIFELTVFINTALVMGEG